MPLLPDSLTRTSVLAETTSSLAASPLLGRQLQQLLEPPVAIRQTTSTAEVAAATKPVGATIDAELTAVNDSPARKQDPVLISGQGVVNTFGIIPLPSEVLFTEAATDLRSGPSIENSLANDRARVAKPATAPLPLLITAQNGFSADMLRPMSSKPVYPPNPNSGAPIVTVDNAYSSAVDGNYCDPNFQGQPVRFSQTVELKLEDLLNQLNSRFGVNFIIGPGIAQLPLNVKAGSIPWNVLLRSQLYVSGVRAMCIDTNTIELVLNDNVVKLEKGRLEGEKLETSYIKLKYLQPSSSGNKNIAGQSTGGGGSSQTGGGGQGGLCQQQGNQGSGQGGGQQSSIPQRCKFERLMNEVRQILGLNDPGALERIESPGISSVTFKTPEAGKRPYVGQVPGRNMLMVNATATQLKEINELIRRADVPPFQVVIKGLVYTANESALKDIGVTASAILGTGNLQSLGGGTSLPVITGTPQPGGTPGAVIPGGIRTLGPGFAKPSGQGDGVFGFSTIIGTAQFSAQVIALQQNGAISLKSRPFATVLDGDTTDLTVGRQVPVIIQAVNNLGGAVGTLQILQAANLLSVTPHVIDDENGNPTAVNLELQLESNDVDTSVVSQGVPSVSVRSIQSNFILNQEQTAILGGFTIDSDTKTVTKTPGLGDIPIIGELFKRRIRTSQISRLYFAISVTVIPYGGLIEPVKVPGATTDPPSITPEMKKRADKAEPKQVVGPK